MASHVRFATARDLSVLLPEKKILSAAPTGAGANKEKEREEQPTEDKVAAVLTKNNSQVDNL